MSIIELLEKIGPGNIGIQLLDRCLVGAKIVDDHGEITFATPPEYAINSLIEGTQQTCLILWLPVVLDTQILNGPNGTPS